MNAVARLFRTYLSVNPLIIGLSLTGIALYIVGTIIFMILPPWELSMGTRADTSLTVQMLLMAAAFVAIIALFFASSFMPLIVARLAMSHQICVLPHGRGRVAMSAVVTTAVLASLTGGLAMQFFRDFPIEVSLGHVFLKAFAISFVDFGLIYVALWVVSRLRGIWLLAGCVLVVLSVSLPLQAIDAMQAPLDWPVALGAVCWAVFIAAFLLEPKLRASLPPLVGFFETHAARLRPITRLRPGSQTDQLLGTGRPWIFACGQVVPILGAAWLVRRPDIFIFLLTLVSAIGGATATYAAPRSKRLWLRSGSLRPELFRLIEASYCRHNGLAVAVQLALLLVGGWIVGMPARMLLLAAPLVLLGALTSTYLGMMMTRGLDWFEATLGVLTMVALGLTALAVTNVATSGEIDRADALLLELVLVVLAATYRTLAKRRWSQLDWMLCADQAGKSPSG